MMLIHIIGLALLDTHQSWHIESYTVSLLAEVYPDKTRVLQTGYVVP